MRFAIALALLLSAGCTAADRPVPPAGAGDMPNAVRLTWLSVTNWLVEAGSTRILLDGYVTRIDRRIVQADGSSSATAAIDTVQLARIVDAVLPDRRLDRVLIGHAHWDHAFDAPGWAQRTGARIGGARTVCHQAVALGIDAGRCDALEGGEVLNVGEHVRVRVVRWHHSGDSLTEGGRRLRAPLELRGPPPVDPATGGLRPGFLEDYLNGGGSRAYLITVRTTDGPVTLFWSNTGNAQAWDAPVPADSTFFRNLGIDLSHAEWAASDTPTRAALAEALRAEGLDGVDVWIGFPGEEHVRQVVATLRPRAFMPHHWDDYWEPIRVGRTSPYPAADVNAALDALGVRALVPATFETFRVDTAGITSEGDRGIGGRIRR